MRNRIIALMLTMALLAANTELAAAVDGGGSQAGSAAVVSGPAAEAVVSEETEVVKTGLVEEKGASYYYKSDGTRLKNSWKKIGKYRYYFGSNGKMKTNTIVGKYYVNEKGRRVTEKAAMNAVKLVKKVSKNKKNNTKAKKLKACYNYISKNYTYKRSYENPTSKGKRWYSSYANDMFTKKKGNCYKYACAFAYCAKVLGYDARVVIGKVGVYGGPPSAPHGWVETKTSKGTIYMYDPNMQMYTPGVNSYKRTYKNPPRKYKKQKVYTIKL